MKQPFMLTPDGLRAELDSEATAPQSDGFWKVSGKGCCPNCQTEEGAKNGANRTTGAILRSLNKPLQSTYCGV